MNNLSGGGSRFSSRNSGGQRGHNNSRGGGGGRPSGRFQDQERHDFRRMDHGGSRDNARYSSDNNSTDLSQRGGDHSIPHQSQLHRDNLRDDTYHSRPHSVDHASPGDRAGPGLRGEPLRSNSDHLQHRDGPSQSNMSGPAMPLSSSYVEPHRSIPGDGIGQHSASMIAPPRESHKQYYDGSGSGSYPDQGQAYNTQPSNVHHIGRSPLQQRPPFTGMSGGGPPLNQCFDGNGSNGGMVTQNQRGGIGPNVVTRTVPVMSTGSVNASQHMGMVAPQQIVPLPSSQYNSGYGTIPGANMSSPPPPQSTPAALAVNNYYPAPSGGFERASSLSSSSSQTFSGNVVPSSAVPGVSTALSAACLSPPPFIDECVRCIHESWLEIRRSKTNDRTAPIDYTDKTLFTGQPPDFKAVDLEEWRSKCLSKRKQRGGGGGSVVSQ